MISQTNSRWQCPGNSGEAEGDADPRETLEGRFGGSAGRPAGRAGGAGTGLRGSPHRRRRACRQGRGRGHGGEKDLHRAHQPPHRCRCSAVSLGAVLKGLLVKADCPSVIPSNMFRNAAVLQWCGVLSAVHLTRRACESRLCACREEKTIALEFLAS